MDLLKDNNYVPETDHGKSPIMQTIENALSAHADFAKTRDYNFMDLLNDKGQVPTIEKPEFITASRKVSQPVLDVPASFVLDCLNA